MIKKLITNEETKENKNYSLIIDKMDTTKKIAIVMSIVLSVFLGFTVFSTLNLLDELTSLASKIVLSILWPISVFEIGIVAVLWIEYFREVDYFEKEIKK